MLPQSPEQIQAHYAKQKAAAALAVKKIKSEEKRTVGNPLASVFNFPHWANDEELVIEWCAAGCPPSNSMWKPEDEKVRAWLKEQELSVRQLGRKYSQNLMENSGNFARVYSNCT